MRIHEIIKEKRKSQGLTQEQAAARLGISASAFNKWERGTTYPDITILPALARLLEVDLNTLLSFQEELTDKEISLLASQLSDILMEKGFQAGHELAVEKIKEYPNCGALLYTLAATLEGGLCMLPTTIPEEGRKCYLDEIETFYMRASESKEDWVRVKANVMLASKLMSRGGYREAEERIALLPDGYTADKSQMQAQLYYRMGRYGEAARIRENKILEAANEICTSLYILLDIAVKEKRLGDAEYFAKKARQTAEVYELWEYSACVAEFELSVSLRDKGRCLKILEKMLPALEKDWIPGDYPMYRHVSGKEDQKRRLGYRQQLLRRMISDMHSDEEMVFLRDEKEFQALLKRYSNSDI